MTVIVGTDSQLTGRWLSKDDNHCWETDSQLTGRLLSKDDSHCWETDSQLTGGGYLRMTVIVGTDSQLTGRWLSKDDIIVG